MTIESFIAEIAGFFACLFFIERVSGEKDEKLRHDVYHSDDMKSMAKFLGQSLKQIVHSHIVFRAP